ncbi:HK97-gp10 family putative phage morphogenesis protein [Candidatus Stoquefichus massiliensis]|uniref:HK97-gp10 family putative phage morphogenesis protein n=1 Tax=Candidatus Stoquefichus massiliensis TaxID=1470350 RepID=UPI00048002EE|nr:HK97-gp10 family putative phage morphogenesis protein [Candidatus Stoquefichus massiliensis]
MSNIDLSKLFNKLSELDSKVAKEAVVEAVSQGGLIVQSQARLLITSDSHALERSVRIKKEIKDQVISSTVYTNSEYGAYYEFGTGPNGQANHAGISPAVIPRYSQRGWMIPADAMSVEKAESYGYRVAMKDGEVIGYYTKGQMARPFMYPALKNHEKDIIKNSKKIISSKIKEICKK